MSYQDEDSQFSQDYSLRLDPQQLAELVKAVIAALQNRHGAALAQDDYPSPQDVAGALPATSVLPHTNPFAALDPEGTETGLAGQAGMTDADWAPRLLGGPAGQAQAAADLAARVAQIRNGTSAQGRIPTQPGLVAPVGNTAGELAAQLAQIRNQRSAYQGPASKFSERQPGFGLETADEAATTPSTVQRSGRKTQPKVQLPGRKTAQPSTAEIQDYIRQQAKAHGVPEALVLGLVQKESNFNPQARGALGEVGLFQVMRNYRGHTLTDAKGRKFKADTQRASSDWQYNVKVGMAILRNSYKWAQTHIPNGVAAATYAHYNGGGNWKYYKNPHSNVNQHVYGYTRHQPGHAPQYIPGYMDYYHQWGGTEK